MGRVYHNVAEHLVEHDPFSASISFGKLICVFIFRNISATLPSGVK